MPIEYRKFITRQQLKAEREKLFVFGDNVQRRGYRGQAAHMRGEPNAVGIATKLAPHNGPSAFFKDEDSDWIFSILREDIDPLLHHLKKGGTVVWPSDGIGTGLSQLPRKAPRIWNILENTRRYLEDL